jgi:hypothetical protein
MTLLQRTGPKQKGPHLRAFPSSGGGDSNPRPSGYEIARTVSRQACSRMTGRLRCSQISPDLLNMEPRMASRHRVGSSPERGSSIHAEVVPARDARRGAARCERAVGVHPCADTLYRTAPQLQPPVSGRSVVATSSGTCQQGCSLSRDSSRLDRRARSAPPLSKASSRPSREGVAQQTAERSGDLRRPRPSR